MTLYDRSFLSSDGRKCVRCGADVHPPDPPHVCADLAARYERQAKAVAAVKAILVAAAPPGYGMQPGIEWHDDTALAIVEALAGRDLGT